MKNALGTLMQSVIESSEKNLESIANKITKNLIPALQKDTFEENTLVQDSKFLTLQSNFAN
jgi:hypothetical protein